MTTTTLYKIIESELHKRTNINEIIDEDGNLVFFDDDHQIMPKILQFDDDTQAVVNDLFGGFYLEDAGHDHHFKKTFALRFMNRQINRQTVEAFKMQLISTFLTSESYINRVYADLEKYLEQTGTSEGTTKNLTKEISNQINEQLNNQLDKRESMENTRQNNEEDTLETNEEDTRQTNEEDTLENSTQNVEGMTTTDDRQAHAELPQNNVNLDVNSTQMDSADTNDISRNKQSNNQETGTDTTGHREGLTTGHSEGSTTGHREGSTTGENSRDEMGELTSETKGTTDSVSDSENEGETHTVTKSFQLDELFKTNGVLEGIFRQFDKKCFLQIW